MEDFNFMGVVVRKVSPQYIIILDISQRLFIFDSAFAPSSIKEGDLVLFTMIKFQRSKKCLLMPREFLYTITDDVYYDIDKKFDIPKIWIGINESANPTSISYSGTEQIFPWIKWRNFNPLENSKFPYEIILSEITQIDSYIKTLDISKIIESIKIELKESYTKKLGDDDSYYVFKETSIQTDDPYLKTLCNEGRQYLYTETAFVPWHILKEESGYNDAHFGIIMDESTKLRSEAKLKYSYSLHLAYLLSLKIKEWLLTLKRNFEFERQMITGYPVEHYKHILQYWDFNSIKEFIDLNNKRHSTGKYVVYSSFDKNEFERWEEIDKNEFERWEEAFLNGGFAQDFSNFDFFDDDDQEYPDFDLGDDNDFDLNDLL